MARRPRISRPGPLLPAQPQQPQIAPWASAVNWRPKPSYASSSKPHLGREYGEHLLTVLEKEARPLPRGVGQVEGEGRSHSEEGMQETEERRHRFHGSHVQGVRAVGRRAPHACMTYRIPRFAHLPAPYISRYQYIYILYSTLCVHTFPPSLPPFLIHSERKAVIVR